MLYYKISSKSLEVLKMANIKPPYAGSSNAWRYLNDIQNIASTLTEGREGRQRSLNELMQLQTDSRYQLSRTAREDSIKLREAQHAYSLVQKRRQASNVPSFWEAFAGEAMPGVAEYAGSWFAKHSVDEGWWNTRDERDMLLYNTQYKPPIEVFDYNSDVNLSNQAEAIRRRYRSGNYDLSPILTTPGMYTGG